MYKFLEKIRAFMYGRNGFDRITPFTMFAYLLLNGTKIFFRFFLPVYIVMSLIAAGFLAITVFRFLSKNVEKRRREAARFEAFLIRINFDGMMFRLRKKMKRLSVRISQFRTHRFRTCPGCNEHLRLSKKRGIRRITCPKCGKKFKSFVPF